MSGILFRPQATHGNVAEADPLTDYPYLATSNTLAVLKTLQNEKLFTCSSPSRPAEADIRWQRQYPQLLRMTRFSVLVALLNLGDFGLPMSSRIEMFKVQSKI